jgi:hypothetical protein
MRPGEEFGPILRRADVIPSGYRMKEVSDFSPLSLKAEKHGD